MTDDTNGSGGSKDSPFGGLSIDFSGGASGGAAVPIDFGATPGGPPPAPTTDAPNQRGRTESKLLIIGIQKDQATRRNWEDRFTEELTKHGVAAVPAYTLFPGDLPDTQRVVEVVQREGYDGVVMTRPLASTVESRWVPGYVRNIPELGYDPWYGVYYNYYRRVYEPGYVETDQVVRYEINLWSTRDPGRLVWTGTTESVDPTSVEQVSREISAKIVPELQEQGVLASR